ncbi:MAG TPA: hypothetical protein VNR87_08330 [Flavisolibacter sp.]|nr:hypothetical protein [Flavisolibacter sp.]
MKIRSWLPTRLIMCAVMCLPTILVFAQGDPGGDPDPAPNGDVPFDGGITLLVAAGIGYAAKKGYDKRKRKKAAEEKTVL